MPWDKLKVTSKLTGRSFVAIELNQPLKLLLRGEKRPKLISCKCTIPVLDLEAESLNHAFTLITDAFEPERISRGGNVFNNLAAPDGDGHWELLDDVRKLYEDRLEERRHFALLFKTILAEAREKHKATASLNEAILEPDMATVQGYFDSCLEPLGEAFWASCNCLIALDEVQARIPEDTWNALKSIAARYSPKATPLQDIASMVSPRISTILPLLYKLVEKDETLTNGTIALVTKWARAFLAAFEQARYKPDGAVQMLAELERLSPKQRTAVLAYAKQLAEGKIQVAK